MKTASKMNIEILVLYDWDKWATGFFCSSLYKAIKFKNLSESITETDPIM